jgi:hypothetical protein
MLSHLKKIMKTILFLVALIIPFISKAQKMGEPNIDKFTNDTTLFTSIEKIGTNVLNFNYSEQLEAYYSKSNRFVYLHLIVELPDGAEKFFRVSEGNSILIKLADNTLISLQSLADVNAKIDDLPGGFLGQGIPYWRADVTLESTKETMAKLSSSVITAIRVQSDKSNIDFDINTKSSDIIKKMIQLINAAK